MTAAPKKNPCGSCPYRRDVPSGVWHPSEYAKLAEYDRPFIEQPQGAFHCHQQDDTLCSGWVGTHDMMSTLAFRLNARHFDDPQAILDYECGVPLFDSGQEAADHGMAMIDNPPEAAIKVTTKLVRKGLDVEFRDPALP